LAEKLREWYSIAGSDFIARSPFAKKELGKSISRVSVYEIVRKYGKRIGLPKLTPADLRFTYAHLAYDAGMPVAEIKERLGHAKVKTTL